MLASRDFVARALAEVERSCRPWSRGWCAALAGILEASAPKPGNVRPGAAFTDLSFTDLVAAAVAAAPAIDRARAAPLGRTILDAVRAAAVVTPSNANLGIVLLVAPLAAVPGPERLAPGVAEVDGVLANLTAADAADVWRAIAIARPGGLGTSDRWDVAGPPPTDIRAAMRHAADRDTIARLWAHGYEPLFAGPVADLEAELAAGRPLVDAIVRAFLAQLARVPDTLVARRHGAAAAAELAARAAAVLAGPDAGWRAAAADLDHSLREPRRVNPGTTADLLAAALYILLVDGRLRPFLDVETPPFPAPGPDLR